MQWNKHVIIKLFIPPPPNLYLYLLIYRDDGECSICRKVGLR